MALSRLREIVLAATVGLAYAIWGAQISLQPPFYPTEAEARGATSSQVGRP